MFGFKLVYWYGYNSENELIATFLFFIELGRQDIRQDDVCLDSQNLIATLYFS